ncbi:MAG: hypothetical protein WHU94_11850 [Thermogemmata sp.]|uniref:Uncharacterized protein n=1 Tax=Thermogemmata fonticola TaxID=2755323 RepID=A0A7V8VDF2_9BACT|nr:hypothetical protein [Thermogemmata fonticola]MBA2225975.1 hypothetical protein [Thermogemmata fonticola]MCX8138409.1 hypothetical protein [Gemmataceae bacterium]
MRLLLPLLATGCNIAHEAIRNFHHEPRLLGTQWIITQRLQQQAREAWKSIRGEFPDCAPEFREGFLDGYVDYLDRGGPAHLPAVPPSKYTRHPRYFTPEGHARLQQYFLGFQLGQQQAIASGQRRYLTVPVLLPSPPPEPPPFRLAQPSASSNTPPPSNDSLPPEQPSSSEGSAASRDSPPSLPPSREETGFPLPRPTPVELLPRPGGRP